MKKIHTKEIVKHYRTSLRNNMTGEERILWACLKGKKMGHLFYRQHSIDCYIVDFYCPARKLVIELDGSHHIDNKEYDEMRTKYLNSCGYKVIRFWNSEVKNNLRGVWKCIEENLRE